MNPLEPLKFIARMAQKPQGALAGAFGEITNLNDPLKQRIQDYETAQAYGLEGLSGISEQEYLEAKNAVGDLSQENSLGNLLSATGRGFNKNVSPSNLIREDENGVGGKIVGGVADVLGDPMLLAGPLMKAASVGKLGSAEKFVDAAGTFGKLEDASKGEKAAQYARRLYQGTLGTMGDANLAANPLMAIGMAAGIGATENMAAKLAPRLIARLASGVNTQGLDVTDTVSRGLDGDLSESVMSKFAREAEDGQVINAAYQDAMRKAAAESMVPDFGVEQGMRQAALSATPEAQLAEQYMNAMRATAQPAQRAVVPQFDETLQALVDGGGRRTVDQGLMPITVRDPMPQLDEARRLVVGSGNGSTANLVQELGVRREPARQLMNQLQMEGVVGRRLDGTDFRDVLQSPMTRPEVPMFDDSLATLVESLQRGMPVPTRAPLALNAAPQSRALGVLSPTSEAETLAQIQELIALMQDPRRRAAVMGQLSANSTNL